MTLKYMQGFETCRDDSDARAQGLMKPPGTGTLQTGYTASTTGVVGTSLRLVGAGSTTAALPGVANTPDIGFINTGVTVNQAWLAGGFTLGFSGRFNSGTSASYGSTVANNSNGICFDGTKYWAIRAVGSTYNVCTSPDLQNWTATTAQPGTATGTGTTISYLGGGVVAVCPVAASALVYTTSNNGASWTSTTVATSATVSFSVSAGSTGNASYPHYVICCGTPTSGTPYPLMLVSVGTLGGTMTPVYSNSYSTATAGTSFAGSCKTIGSLIVCSGWIGTGNNGAFSVISMAPSASAGTTASWTTATSSGYPNSTLPVINDIIFCPASNVYLLATSTGISTMPNGAGTAGVPNQVAAGAYTLTSRYSTVGMQRVFLSGSTYVGIGLQGHIVTSPDGITWTESGGHLLPVGVSGCDWRSAIYDGSRYVLCSDATTGMIATTPDFLTNYQAQYVMDPAETAPSPNNAYYYPGLICTTAPVANATAFTAGTNMVCVAVNAASGGTRTVGLSYATASYETQQPAVSVSPLTHYYEIVGTSSSGTTNGFVLSLYIDGLLAATGTATRQITSQTDPTYYFVITLGRGSRFTAIDDVYFTLNDGNGLVGPIGVINIVAQRPETDIQAQWVKTGSAASNSASVNQSSLSSQSSNYVSSSNAGDKDIYGTADVLPSGYTPKAIMTEAFFTKTSTTAPTVSLGTLSGSTEVDGTGVNITGATATYVNQILERDPNGNAAWTAYGVNSAKFVLNHTA
jgi:hypothetical protein